MTWGAKIYFLFGKVDGLAIPAHVIHQEHIRKRN
jgi:hypothetical protein